MLNGEKTIKDCLSSIFNQDHDKDFEVIVVDNGSDDRSLQILSEFDERIQVLHLSEKNRSKARNLGASIAKGTFFAFIDCDVILSKNWTSLLLNEFSKRDIKGAQGQIIPYAQQGRNTFLDSYRTNELSHILGERKSLLEMKELFECPMIDSAACIYDHKIFLSLRGFDEYLIRHEDIDLSRRINVANYNLSFVRDAIANEIWVDKSLKSWLKRSYMSGHHKRRYMEKWQTYYPNRNFIENIAHRYDSFTHRLHCLCYGARKYGIRFSLFRLTNVLAYICGLYLSKQSYPGESLKYNLKERGIVYSNDVTIEFI